MVAGRGGAIGGAKDSVRTALAAQADGGQCAEGFTSSRFKHRRHRLHLVRDRLSSVFGFSQQAVVRVCANASYRFITHAEFRSWTPKPVVVPCVF